MPAYKAEAEAETVAWVDAVLRHAAYRLGQTTRQRAEHEVLDDKALERIPAGERWEDAVAARLDAAALCSHFTGKEERACRILAATGPISERELARHLHVSQSTAHRVKCALMRGLSAEEATRPLA